MAGSVILHCVSVGNTSRARRSTSPAAEVCGKILVFGVEVKKIVDCCA